MAACPVCDRCGSVDDASPVAKRPGVYRCRACGKDFRVTVGTPMEDSHLPLGTWYLAMYLHDRDHAASRVILRDATVVRAAGVAPVRREPASAMRRKRGPVVSDGGEAGALPSHGEPPSSVVVAHQIASCQ